jgi:hypothetical protein
MNDEELTPILLQALEITAKPFRVIECAGIVDSSKMSQMRSAHSRWIEYGDDEREGADWMKVHALVGVETLICMGVKFSGSRGVGSHDVNFLLPLVEMAEGVFKLRHILADKAYLSEQIVGSLFEMGIQAIIPVKKRLDFKNAKRYYEVMQQLVQWYDSRPADFHEYYRLRPKIESFFSLLKHFAGGFCWSRGRPRKERRRGGFSDRKCGRAMHSLDQRVALQGHLREPTHNNRTRNQYGLQDELSKGYVLPRCSRGAEADRITLRR